MKQSFGTNSSIWKHLQLISLGYATMAFLGACAPSNMNGTSDVKEANASSSRIVNGVELTDDDVLSKSTVAIAEVNGEEQDQFCSGTLIAKNLVLTAGHCGEYLGRRQGSVLFGLTDKKSVSIRIAKIIIHKQYNNDSEFVYLNEPIGQNWNDLALILLASDAPAGYVPAAVLTDDSMLMDKDTVTLAGYGLTSGGFFGAGAGTLRKTEVPVALAKFSDQEFATDESAHGSCNGDSGGPVYLTKNNKTYLVGVTSRGDRNCKAFGVYTAVSRFQPWLTETSGKITAKTPATEEERSFDADQLVSDLISQLNQ